MTDACAHMQDKIPEFVTGGLAGDQMRAVEEHVRQCPICRAHLQAMQEDDRRLAAYAESMRAAIHGLNDAVVEALDKGVSVESQTTISTWRIVMKNHYAKFATAAAVIIVVGLISVMIADPSATSVYAVEQTIEANHSVRSIHWKHFMAWTDLPMELWAEFDESGQLLRFRLEEPRYHPTEGDGRKAVVWCDNRGECWFKDKGLHIIIRDVESASLVRKGMEEMDPRLLVEHLQAQEAEGKVQIKIQASSEEAGAIVLTATYLPASDSPEKRLVLLVDGDTKLVKRIERYELVENDYEFQSREEILAYNEPMGADTFVLNVPEDVKRIDQTTREIGLVQGDLSDEEIAVRVVREALEALIAEDYAKAGNLFGGLPADAAKQRFGKVKFLRVISIGTPTSEPQKRGLLVPYEVEIERDGQTEVIEKTARAGHVRGQPDRWEVFAW